MKQDENEKARIEWALKLDKFLIKIANAYDLTVTDTIPYLMATLVHQFATINFPEHYLDVCLREIKEKTELLKKEMTNEHEKKIN